MKLPRNLKEKLLFMLIVSLISVNIIGPIISMCEIGFSWNNYLSVLPVLPFIWVAVVITVLIAEKPATYLQEKITDKNDSFNTQITINILCNVIIISALMTILGSWIGQKHLPVETLHKFFIIWPRNFGIALVIETLIAQPIARKILFLIHTKIDKKTTKN
ncbi:hypothetical protein [Lactobacillus sp.]|uniref:hypothetical protein n=1 Tax=Lactobacillus sp. TaxID=1591 RepID=UPI0025B93058|nr:hypothetical protein [Lactobacillus sp.]